jgi:dynein heavy chain 1
MEFLPHKLEKMKRVGNLVKNPLFRFLEREVTVLSDLLKIVRNDLDMVGELCTGDRKSTA